MNVQKILFPTDSSEQCEKVKEAVIAMARSSQAAVVVMHAFNPPLTLRKRGAIMIDEFKSSMEEEATEIVTEAVESLQAAGISATGLAVEGTAAEAILKAIEDEQPDLVIMGSRGAGGWPGVRLGSVAERVVRHSPVAVLVIK